MNLGDKLAAPRCNCTTLQHTTTHRNTLHRNLGDKIAWPITPPRKYSNSTLMFTRQVQNARQGDCKSVFGEKEKGSSKTSNFACVNELCHSFHSCEWVVAYIFISHIIHINKSCHTYGWVTSHNVAAKYSRQYRPQQTVAHWNALQHIATYCNTHRHTLHHTAPQCNTMPHN